MGLDLEGDGDAVAEVDDAGVLGAGGDEDAGGVAGEEAQQGLGVLVAAVLAPECAEEAELDGVGFAVNALDDTVVLVGGEGDFGEGLGGHGHASSVLHGGMQRRR